MKNEIVDLGLDTRNIVTGFPNIKDPDFIITSPCRGNDYIIEPGFPKKPTLIIVMEEDIEPGIILYHLQALHKEEADIVLAPKGTKYIDDYRFLREEAGYIGSLGIYMPETIKDIEEFGYEPECLGLTMNPLNFNYDFLKYKERMELEKDKIIQILGFPDQDIILPDSYKLTFYSRYCSGVALNYNNNYTERINFLSYLIGADTVPEVELTKSVKKKGSLNIGTSLKLGEDLIIPCPESDFLANPEEIVYGLGKVIEKIPDQKEEDLGEIEKLAYSLWESMETERYGREELIDYIRYRIVSLIDYKYNIGYLTRCALILAIQKKKKVIENYLFYVGEDKNFFVCNLKNTVKEA